MTIESINSKIPISTRSSPKAASVTKSAGGSVSSDKIDTQIADKIKSALASSTTATSVNSERIAGIRQSISDGTYVVNAQRVAAKMVKFEQNLPNDETSA